jgi:hypothetical protein
LGGGGLSNRSWTQAGVIMNVNAASSTYPTITTKINHFAQDTVAAICHGRSLPDERPVSIAVFLDDVENTGEDREYAGRPCEAAKRPDPVRAGRKVQRPDHDQDHVADE